jgi:hypothetical protein
MVTSSIWEPNIISSFSKLNDSLECDMALYENWLWYHKYKNIWVNFLHIKGFFES